VPEGYPSAIFSTEPRQSIGFGLKIALPWSVASLALVEGPGGDNAACSPTERKRSYAVVAQVEMEALVERLVACLDDLDRIGAHIPAAHVDAALHALRRRVEPERYPSEMD
jgi:hypothetical protein